MPLAQIAPPLPPPLPISRVCRVRSFPQFISPNSPDVSLFRPTLRFVISRRFSPRFSSMFLSPAFSSPSLSFYPVCVSAFLFASLSSLFPPLLETENSNIRTYDRTWLTFGSSRIVVPVCPFQSSGISFNFPRRSISEEMFRFEKMFEKILRNSCVMHILTD